MTVRSTKLAFLQVATGASSNLYTSPSGWRTIIKDIRASPTTNPPFDVQVWVINHADGNRTHLIWQTGVSAFVAAYTGWVVLDPLDQLQAYAGQQAVRFWASGTLLLLTGAEPPVSGTLPAVPDEWPPLPPA